MIIKTKLLTSKVTAQQLNFIAICCSLFNVPFQLSNKIISILLLLFLLPTSVQAHRGARADDYEIDACRIKVGYEWIHFSAYTPTVTGSQNYCEAIPGIGPTNLVFDYEGKKLRNFTIEFEVTKEPEGTRVFYQEPKKIKSGTVNAVVDFSNFGAGNYLAHVTIVHKGKKLDEHIAFSVGLEKQAGFSFISILLVLIFIVISAFMVRRYINNNKISDD